MAKTYTPIPGLGTGRLGFQGTTRTRLYQGPDHLLVVESSGYTEEYRRIFYRDIRYVEVRKNQVLLWQAIISGGIVACLLLLHLLSVSVMVTLILSLPFFIFLLVCLSLGPTCDCYLSTEVQTLRIPTPRRRNKVARLIDFLRAQTARQDA